MLRAASRLVPVAGAVALGAAGAMALRADLLIGYGLSKAFEARNGGPTLAAAASASRTDKAEVGDEAYWLMGSGDIASPVVFGRRLVVGDRFVITAPDGRPRHLEVAGIKYVGRPLLNVASPAATRLMRVSFRVVDPGRVDKEELVHLLVEVELPKPAALHAQDGPLGPT